MVRKGTPHGPLYRLIYYSRNILASTLSGEALKGAVNEIVGASRRHNEADHLSGCLMCSPTAFAGVLEGAREGVERTFQRISDDRRHADVRVVSLTPTARALFAGMPLALAWRAQAGSVDPLRHLFAETEAGAHRATTGGDVLRLLQAAAERATGPVNGAAFSS